jgi:hypothetical protein
MKFTKEILSQQVYPQVLIPSGNQWASTESLGLTVIETGPKGKLLEQMVAAVYQAKEMVCLQSFLMQDNKLFQALVEMVDKKGIRVFVMGSAEARLSDSHEEAEDFRKGAYIELLDRQFKGRFLFRQAATLHGKYLLVDPRGSDAQGFICTNNFNLDPFFKNPELGVCLTKEQIAELYQVFVYHFWECTTDMQTDRKDFDRVQPANHFQFPKLNHLLATTLSPGDSNLGRTLLRMVDAAQKSIEISSFSFESGQALAKLLLEKAKKGIEVTVFSPPRSKNIDGFLRDIKKAGGKVYLNDRLHAKFLLVDRTVGSIFTANVAAEGMETGMEVGIVLSPDQVVDLGTISDRWKRDFQFEYKVGQNIQEAPMEFCVLENGKSASVKTIVSEARKLSKKIAHLKELRQAFMEFGNAAVAVHARRLDLTLELTFSVLPHKVISENEINRSFSIVIWQEGKGEKRGIVARKTLAPESLNGVASEYDQLPVFLGK